MRNFSDISEQLIKKDGLTVIRNAQELSDEFVKLINNQDELKERGEAAFGVFMDNRGALQKIVGYLHKPLQA